VPSVPLRVPLQQELEETVDILYDLAGILLAQFTLHTRLPELDRLIKKFVRVPAHDCFAQPPRNRTDNEQCRKSSRSAHIAGVTDKSQIIVKFVFQNGELVFLPRF